MFRRVMALMLSVVVLAAAFPTYAEEAEYAVAELGGMIALPTPTESPTPAPTEAPAEVPTQVFAEAPAEILTEVPAAEAAEIPTEVADATPAETPAEDPTASTEETPDAADAQFPSPEDTAELPPEASDTQEPTATPVPEPLQVALTPAVRSAFVGDAVQLILTVSGGAGQLTASYQLTVDGQPDAGSSTNAISVGENSYTFTPTTNGYYTIHVAVTDEAQQRAETIVTLPVAQHDTDSLAHWSGLASAVKLTGNWRQDLLAVAMSQLGYEESKTDFIALEDGSRRVYSVYGDWNKHNYDYWYADFISFCLEYANIPARSFPRSSETSKLLATAKSKGFFVSAGTYAPVPGDIVFLSGDGMPDRAGIVETVSEDSIQVIEGGGSVHGRNYDRGSSAIVGYANMDLAMRTANVSSLVIATLPPTEQPSETLEPGDEYGIAVMNAASSQNYYSWSESIKSYLVDNGSGYMSVELVDDDSRILVKYLNAEYERQSYKYIDLELPLFGGFHAGDDYYYLIFGQNNPKENDSVEVIRVVKYDKTWKRLSAASLRGANTIAPFYAGSLRVTESSGYLYIRTCHQMYKTSDGLNHQSNLTMQVKTSDMSITDVFYDIWNVKGGYVSHSFNQFIIADDAGYLVGLDHGDAYPRSAVLGRYSKKAGNSEGFFSDYETVNLLTFSGSSGANYTGASLGGLEYSSTHYLVAGNSVKQDGQSHSTRNIFITATSRSNFTEAGTTFKWITSYPEGGSSSATTPQLVKLGANSFLLLWEKDSSNISYVFLDGKGNLTSSIYTNAGALSDCKPVVKSGTVSWYVTDSTRTFTYSITSSGTFNSSVTDYSGVDAPTGTFGASNALRWTVDVNNTLTISGNGAIPDMNYYDQPWGKYTDEIQKIVIASGITSIGARVFYDHASVAAVTIANTVTSIGQAAFAGCSSLTSISFPASVTSIGYWALYSCTSLASVIIQNPDCSIAGMGYWNGEPAYALGDQKKVVIYANPNSTAKNYASSNGYAFKTLTLGTPKLSKAEATASGITITWSEVDSASSYRVLYKTGSDSWTKLAETSSTSYTWTKPQTGVKYSFTVASLDSLGNAGSCDTVGLSVTYITAPRLSKAENIGTGVKISWEKVTGAAKYRVFYKTGSGAWTKLADTTSASYSWPSAKSGTKYGFTVACLDDAGNAGAYDASGLTLTYLAQPKLSKVENAATGAKITWGAVTGAAKYRVYYKTGTGSWTKLTDTASASYTWTAAKSGTQYSFSVASIDDAGNVGTYDTTGLSLTYLAAPKLSSAANAATGAKVTWGAVTGAAKYRVFYKTGTGSWTKITDTTSTSYTWTAAKSGTQYSFSVAAIDGAGTVGTHDTTGTALTYLAAPKLSSAANAATGAKVTWSAVTGAAKYRVFYKTGTGSWTKIADTTSASYTWTAAKSGTKYSFSIAAIDSAGNLSAYDTTGLALTYIAQPKVSKVENATTGAKITWGAVTGAAKYRVYYKTGTGSWTKIADTTSTSYTWTAAKSGTQYSFSVAAIDSAGTVGTHDTTGTALTYLAAPKLSKVEKVSSGIKITWGKVTGAAKYRVLYKTGTDGWTKLTDTTSASYTWSGAKNNTKYSFTVVCIDSAGKNYTSAYDTTGASITYKK